MQAGEQVCAGWSSLSSWVFLVLPALGMTLKFDVTLKLPSSLHRHSLLSCALSALTNTGKAVDCSQACPFRKERSSKTCRDAPGHPQRHRAGPASCAASRCGSHLLPLHWKCSCSSSSKQLGCEETLRSGPARCFWCCCCNGGRQLPLAGNPLSCRKASPTSPLEGFASSAEAAVGGRCHLDSSEN